MDKVFADKTEVVQFIGGLYKSFYKENSGKHGFSERSFSTQINVSQSVLNNLRNGYKKKLEPENATKILRGMDKTEFIEPALQTLLPESRGVLFKDTICEKNQASLIDKKDMSELVDFLTSKSYGHILSVVLTGMDKEDVTVEHIKRISPDGEMLLNNLVEASILEVTEQNIVRFSEKVRKIFNNKKIQFDLNQTKKISELFHSIINPFLIERDQDIGYISTCTGCFHKEDIPEYINLCQEFRKKFLALEQKNPGGDIKLGLSILGVSLYNPYKDLNSKKTIREASIDKETIL